MDKIFGYVTKEDIWIANKYIKRHFTALVIRICTLKTTMRDHYTPGTMTKIKKIEHTKGWWRYEENWSLIHNLWESKMNNHFAKNNLAVSSKLNIQLHNLEIPLLGIYPREINVVPILIHKCFVLFVIDKFETTKM